MARSGRRPGTTDTRERILDAARREFSASGYDGATIRGIAAGADVDPALVHHYFGTKDELFVSALRLPVNPAAILPDVIAGGLDGLGRRIVHTMLTRWDASDANPLLMLLRSLASEQVAPMMREFVAHGIVRPMMDALGTPDAPVRATLAASQLGGLMMARYIVKIEPLASLPADEVARLVGPNLQRYLTGDLSA